MRLVQHDHHRAERPHVMDETFLLRGRRLFLPGAKHQAQGAQQMQRFVLPRGPDAQVKCRGAPVLLAVVHVHAAGPPTLAHALRRQRHNPAAVPARTEQAFILRIH